MAPPSLECCVATNLFCTEDVSGCLSDEEDNNNGGLGERRQGACAIVDDHHAASLAAQQLEEPLDVQAAIRALVEREAFHMPHRDYLIKYGTKVLDASLRQKAIDWLFKVRSLYGFGPLTAALSVNYLDRFLSLHQLPNGKAWMMQLLSVACLSLAAKMEETEVPLLLDLQVEPDYIFEPRTVQRMELLVLSTLGWRMSSVSPFSYTDYFIRRLGLSSSAQRVLHARIEEVILLVIRELRFLEFQPSTIAGAAALCGIKEFLPQQFDRYKKMLFLIFPSQLKVPVEKCFRLMLDLFCRGEGCGNSVPQSPAGVLDASFSSDNESIIKSIGSDASVYTPISPPCKKMKLHDLRSHAEACPPL